MPHSNKDEHESSEEEELHEVFRNYHGASNSRYEGEDIIFNFSVPFEETNQAVKIKAVALHEGDYKPIDVSPRSTYHKKDNSESTKLHEMVLSIGLIDTTVLDDRYSRVLHNNNKVSADDLKEPIHEIWSDDYKQEVAQKMQFLNQFMYEFYVVYGERIGNRRPGRKVCEMLFPGRAWYRTDSEGRRCWYQNTLEKRMNQRPSLHSNGSNAPSLLDLYGGDKQMASDAYNNIN